MNDHAKERPTNIRMLRIGEAVDLPARLAQIDASRKQYRAERLARFGWRDDVQCAGCGDTGTMPDSHQPCFCPRGQAIEDEQRRAGGWEAVCPRRFRAFTLDTHPNADATAQVRAWASDGAPVGRNLILLGPVGTGKTGLAIGALRESYISGRTVRYGTVPDLMDQMRPKKPGEDRDDVTLRDLQRVHVLLMDDAGTEKSSEWVVQQTYMVINGRYERELPTILTSNRAIEDTARRDGTVVPGLKTLMGERTISRLTEDAVMVHVGGKDLRRVGAA